MRPLLLYNHIYLYMFLEVRTSFTFTLVGFEEEVLVVLQIGTFLLVRREGSVPLVRGNVKVRTTIGKPLLD